MAVNLDVLKAYLENQHVMDPEQRAMLGLPSHEQFQSTGSLNQGNVVSMLQTALTEQGADGAASLDYRDYITDADLQSQYSDPVGTANRILSRMSAARPDLMPYGVIPFKSLGDAGKRNDRLPGHSDSWTSMFKAPVEAGKDLWADQGFRTFLAVMAGGMGAAAATGAGAGTGTAAAGGTGVGSAGGTGLTMGGGSLGLTPAATGASGLSGSYATGSLAPGFFASETLAPLAAGAGGAALGGAAGSAAGGGTAGGGASSGMGGAGLSGAGSFLSGLSDIWGDVKGVLPSGDTMAALAPIIAAISYAKGQDPFDTSRLRSTYNEFEPNALAYEYDQNTARGRDALTSSLQNRGVMGSSFANMDLENFATSRDLGRRSLINQGLAQRGNIAASILDADVKHRALKNDLYGRSLLALGNVFGGRNQ